tara:strand:+ start:177 stop:512 length:336 start_codon:yes stop_codon:yes gene_type:complete
MAKVTGGKTKRDQVKSIVSRAKQRQNRFFDDGHPLHPTKVAVSGDIFYPDNLNKAANKHKREFPKMVDNIRNDKKKDFKKVKPEPSARSRLRGGGMSQRGLGRAFKKGGRV